MLKLKKLDVGPIVGETTTERVRIWGRAREHIVENMPRRCFGVLRYKKQANKTWGDAQYCKMNPNFDLTGLAIVTGLNANTEYEFQFGYFYSDVEFDDVAVQQLDWSRASDGSFKTSSADDQKPRSLVIGSCRYLLKTFFGDFFDDRGDKTFRSILRQIEDGDTVDQLIMMGDQIYADDMSSFRQDRTIKQFFKRYRDAFSQKYIRQLMSQVPTYMTLDDHEIEDNWPSKASDQDWKTIFPVAMHAYASYQLSHSPNIRVKGQRMVGTPNHLWYQYSDGCVDVFVTDSRTERYPGDGKQWGDADKDGRQMISSEQLSELKSWLKNGSGRVKIIVTSVPFFPDSASSENMDKWFGFSAQREELLAHIEKNQIQKVVFFSGDVHASFSAELVSPSGLKLFSVISSAFFWPYPHPSARHFKTKGSIEGGSAGTFCLENVSRVIGDDNFTRVDVTPKDLTIRVYGRKGGRAVMSTTHTF